MDVHLTSISGIDDAICSMLADRGELTREKELEVRREVSRCARSKFDFDNPDASIGRLEDPSEKLCGWLSELCSCDMTSQAYLSFVKLGISVYGMNRGSEMGFKFDFDDVRMFPGKVGETPSEYYENKILTMPDVLEHLGIDTPDEIEVDGHVYLKQKNGYVLKGFENDPDVQAGLNMLAQSSDFVMQCDLISFARVYKLRGYASDAHFELQTMVEAVQLQLCTASAGYFSRDLLMAKS